MYLIQSYLPLYVLLNTQNLSLRDEDHTGCQPKFAVVYCHFSPKYLLLFSYWAPPDC